jgi:hypothetical protein
MAGEIVRNQIQLTVRMRLRNGIEQPQITRRITAGCGEGQRVPILHP